MELVMFRGSSTNLEIKTIENLGKSSDKDIQINQNCLKTKTVGKILDRSSKISEAQESFGQRIPTHQEKS